MNISQELRLLPYSVTKSQLVAMYRDQMSMEEILKNINEIILENRKKLPRFRNHTDIQIKRAKNVWHLELMEFVATVGVPAGFYLK